MQYQLEFNPLRNDETLQLKVDNGNIVDTKYGVLESSIWCKSDPVVEKLFANDGRRLKMQMFYLDIPSLHEDTKLGQKFIKALQ